MCSAQCVQRPGRPTPRAPSPGASPATPAPSAGTTGGPPDPRRPEAEGNQPWLPEFLAVHELERDDDDHIITLRPDKAAYFFLGSAVTRGLIHARWSPAPELRPHVLYVRTSGGSTYRTKFRSISAIRPLLGRRFVCVHQGLLLNLDALRKLFLRQRVPLAGVAVGNGLEYLTISRRHLAGLRGRIA